MSYSIRKVRTEKEKLGISYLNEILFPSDYPVKLLTEGAVWWIVRHDDTGDIIGFAALFPSSTHGSHVIMERAGVLPEHRGKGLQKRLIQVRLQEARRLGATVVTSWTYNNPTSANNLIDAGFRTFKPSEPWGADGAVYFRLKLKGGKRGTDE